MAGALAALGYRFAVRRAATALRRGDTQTLRALLESGLARNESVPARWAGLDPDDAALGHEASLLHVAAVTGNHEAAAVLLGRARTL